MRVILPANAVPRKALARLKESAPPVPRPAATLWCARCKAAPAAAAVSNYCDCGAHPGAFCRPCYDAISGTRAVFDVVDAHISTCSKVSKDRLVLHEAWKRRIAGPSLHYHVHAIDREGFRAEYRHRTEAHARHSYWMLLHVMRNRWLGHEFDELEQPDAIEFTEIFSPDGESVGSVFIGTCGRRCRAFHDPVEAEVTR